MRSKFRPVDVCEVNLDQLTYARHDQVLPLNMTGRLPLYYSNNSIDETQYITVFDYYGNYYYPREQCLLSQTSDGYYLQWNIDYSEEFYYTSLKAENQAELEEFIDAYTPYPKPYNYLHVSWSDENAWQEWQTIDQVNADVNSLKIEQEIHDENADEYETIAFNSSLEEVSIRQVAIEFLYPFNATSTSYTFELSQDYSEAEQLMAKVTAYSIDGAENDQLSASIVGNTAVITGSVALNSHEIIVLTLFFNDTEQVLSSDYTQFKLTEVARNNRPISRKWSKNDTLMVSYNYTDFDYFLIFEDYEVGAEGSEFSFIEYFRNDAFINYVGGQYKVISGDQEKNFAKFEQKNDEKTVLILQDFDKDGSYENVVEQRDILGTGQYDSFMYGEQDPTGDIAYHTLYQRVNVSDQSIQRVSNQGKTEEYELNADGFLSTVADIWYDLCRGYTIHAQREVNTVADVVSRKRQLAVLIQKDVDGDGIPDEERVEEMQLSSQISVEYTQEITTINWKPTTIFKDPHESIVKESSTGTSVQCDELNSLMFRDFEGEEVKSTRYYADVFPNHEAFFTDSSHFMQVVSNTLGDDDPLNDLHVDYFAVEELACETHGEDSVPIWLDEVLTIEDGQINSKNALASNETLSIPGYYGEYSGLDQLEISVIKVTPKEGVVYDNDVIRSAVPMEGTYYYFDGDDDLRYETIFSLDEEGNVLGIGFDTDGDLSLTPNTKRLVKRAGFVQEDTGFDDDKFSIELIQKHSLTFFEAEDDLSRQDGYFLEPTLSDSFFETWKLTYSAGSSRLIEEVKTKTANDVLEQLTIERFADDVAWQVAAQMTGLVVGAIVGGIAGLYTGPGGAAIAGKAGYFAGYLVVNTINAWLKDCEYKNMIKAYKFTPDGIPREEETLTEKWWMDEYFGGASPGAITGSGTGVYVPVQAIIDDVQYMADVILAPYGETKTGSLGSSILQGDLDYYLQTRNYMQYSDLDDQRLIQFLIDKDGFYFNAEPEYMHVSNSITRVEQAFSEATDGRYDKIVPTMFASIPMLEVASSQEGQLLPEFYLDHPLYSSQEAIPSKQDEQRHVKIYKVIDMTDEMLTNENDTIKVQVTHENGEHLLHANITSFTLHVNVDVGYIRASSAYTQEILTNSSNIQFNPYTGMLEISASQTQQCKQVILSLIERYSSVENPCIIVELNVDKHALYNASEISPNIIAMQSVGATILEYFYQYRLSADTAAKLEELAYTVKVTVASTLASTAIIKGVGKVMGKLTSWINNFPDLTNYGLSAPTSASGSSLRFLSQVSVYLMQGGIGTSAYTIAYACLKESIEETMIDPWLEGLGSGIAASLGAGTIGQIIGGMILESGRETALGEVMGMFRSSSQNEVTFTKFLAQKQLKPQGSELIEQFNLYKQEMQDAWNEKSWFQRHGPMIFSSLGMFATAFTGATVSGLIGPTMASSITTLSLIAEDELNLGESFTKFIESKLKVQEREEKFEDIFRPVLGKYDWNQELPLQLAELVYSVSEKGKLRGERIDAEFIKTFNQLYKKVNPKYRGTKTHLAIMQFAAWAGLDVIEYRRGIGLVGIAAGKRCNFNYKNMDYIRHVYIETADYLGYKEMSCIFCGELVGMYQLQTKEIIFNKAYNLRQLIKLEERKGPNDAAIYRIRFRIDPRGDLLDFPGNIYVGKSVQQVKREVAGKYAGRHGRLGEHLDKYSFNSMKDFWDILKIDVLQIIRFQGTARLMSQKIDQAEKFWIAWHRSQFEIQRGLNIEEGGSSPIKLKKIVSFENVEDAFEELISVHGMFYKNQGPREKLIEILDITREELEANLQWLYGTNSVTEILKSKVMEKVKKEFERGYNPTEIATILPIDFGAARPDKPVTDLIKDIYRNELPNIDDLRVNEIRNNVLGKIIIEKVREGYYTYSSLLNVLPGFASPGQKPTAAIATFIRKNMRLNYKQLIEDNRYYINRRLFSAAKDFIVNNQGRPIYASDLMRELINSGVIIDLSINRVNEGGGAKFISKYFYMDFDDLVTLSLTNYLPPLNLPSDYYA